MTFKWENPPAQTRGSASPDELEAAAQLKTQPQTWARILEFDTSTKAGAVAQLINNGTRAAFREGYEAKSRTIDGKGYVYARFVGTSPQS